jgi:hypothetical protein
MNGYFTIYRKLGESELWLSEKFTRGQAWVDLIMLASHKENTFQIRGIKVKVNRGQLAWSEVSLAKRWRWSRGRVRRFLNGLENEQRIVQQKNKVTSLITLINYDRYQLGGTSDGTSGGTTDGTQTRNIKNIRDRGAAKKRAATLPPDEIQFTKTHQQLAEKSGASLDDEWSRYCDWAYSKGERRVDHLRAFNNWLRRCTQYNLNNGEPICRLKEADYDD